MNSKQNSEIVYEDLGVVDYQQAWDYQEEIFAKTISLKIQNRDLPLDLQHITSNFLLFCEHPNVYTLGKSGKQENLLLDEHGLEQAEAQYYKINRGGDITYHGPGQLVGYPIFDLENFFTDIHQYMRFLEQAVINTCAAFGLDAGRIDGLTGVWLDHNGGPNPRKICAMGVKSSRWVTMHGLALNVNTNLSYFKNIIPCGIDDKAVTSLQAELGFKVDMDNVKQVLRAEIEGLFKSGV